jgi:hypothetical protein
VTVAEENKTLLIQEDPMYSQDSKALTYGFVKQVISTFNLMFPNITDGNNFTIKNALINFTVCPVLAMFHCISFRAA